MQIALAIVLILSSVVGTSLQAARSLRPQTDRSRELETAVELSSQVVKLYGDKKYDEALPIARKVVEIRQRLLAQNDVLLAAALINLEVQTEDIVNGRALTLMQPSYPPAAREKHLSGAAFIAVLIDRNGNVEAAKSVCGDYAELNASSVQAARLSKFSPTKVNGEAIRVTGLIVYRFIAQ